MSKTWKFGTKLLSVNCCGALTHKKDKLWVRWVDAYYMKGRNPTDITYLSCCYVMGFKKNIQL